MYESDSDLKIRVSYDVDDRTITISDNGIGMSRQEVIDHIGTIAKSGTREFFNSLTGDQAKDAHLIGQFGVGFYSAFIIADKVTLVTRRAGLTAEHGVRWESSGEGITHWRPLQSLDEVPTSSCICAKTKMSFSMVCAFAISFANIRTISHCRS